MAAAAIEWANKDSVLKAASLWPTIFNQEFETALRTIVEVTVAEVIKLTPTGMGGGAFGHLANSIQSGEPFREGHGIVIEYGTPAEHAWPIEVGRRPGATMPPVSGIEEWVVWRGMATGAEARQIAFLIARAIGRRGYKNRPEGWQMFWKGRQKADPKYAAILDVARANIDRRVSGGL